MSHKPFSVLFVVATLCALGCSSFAQDTPNQTVTPPAAPSGADKLKQTPLMLAAIDGDLTRLKAMIVPDTDLNTKDTRGWTALTYAAAGGKVDCVKALIEAKADVSVRGKNGISPLVIASIVRKAAGNLESVRALVAAGADGSTPLMAAAVAGDRDSVKALSTDKKQVNARNKNGWTALTFASLGGDSECVLTLIAAGANPNVKSSCGQTPLMFAAQSGSVDCVKALIEAKANIKAKETIDGWTPLMYAAFYGNTDCLQALCDAGADVNAKDRTGETALVIAVYVARAKTYKEAGMNPFASFLLFGLVGLAVSSAMNADLPKNTYLYGEGAYSVSTVKALIAGKANLNARDMDGMTPLMECAKHGSAECVQALIEAGADYKVKDKHHKTALSLAASEEVAGILRSAGATE